MPDRVLDRRALNRALLARQHLLERAPLPVAGMLEHLAGMQAQEPQAPFVGLWSRLEGFDPAELDGLLERREAVRIMLMRATVHLVTARDCLAFRPMVAELLRKRVVGSLRRELGGVGLDDVERLATPMLEAEPLQSPEVGRRLAAIFGAGAPAALGWATVGAVPAVQLPPRGLWGRTGPARLTTAQRWLGAELGAETRPDAFVLRHLAAFGPATTSDIRMWCGRHRHQGGGRPAAPAARLLRRRARPRAARPARRAVRRTRPRPRRRASCRSSTTSSSPTPTARGSSPTSTAG